MSKIETFVSVVTPVYNGEKYLAECIESVLAQTYPHWEYIILDNCSSDKTNEIARQYAEKDNRIVVFRNDELVDVVTNHNNAYQKISSDSKYCKLLQADDWMFPDCLHKMVRLAEQHPAVGIVGAYSLAGKRVRNDGLSYLDTVISGHTVARQTLLGNYYLFWSPSSLMIRSDLIRARKPFYNPEHLHSDDDSIYILLQECDFGFVYQVLTFIREHEDSLTSMVAKPMNRLIVSNLHLYVIHGRTYLSPDEYRLNLEKKLKSYYHFLAANAFDLREINFWQYHKEGFKKIGLHFNRIKFTKAILGLFINQPKQSIGRMLRAFYQKVNK
jgi:glycosyltransferase involved in cell wall biosynthesis